MNDTTTAAIAQVTQCKNRLDRGFGNTPEERLNWSPGLDARTPIQLVAHSAFSLGFIREMLCGTPYAAKTTAEADAQFLVMEKGITSREEAQNLLDRNFNSYVAHLESIDEEHLDGQIEMPFGLGLMPLRHAIFAGAWHTQDHAAQLEYLQTIYGDRSW